MPSEWKCRGIILRVGQEALEFADLHCWTPLQSCPPCSWFSYCLSPFSSPLSLCHPAAAYQSEPGLVLEVETLLAIVAHDLHRYCPVTQANSEQLKTNMAHTMS